ncbi:coiled-coil domain-containing protein 185 [Mantella aurantiaca]
MKDGRESPSLHLDLSNFEDGAGSRYVLTSPRSLEACARLGVRPVELLHKSLEEVREENPEAGDRRLKDLYEAQEKERRRKLEMCRELRMELLEGDRGSAHTPGGHKDYPTSSFLDHRDSPHLSTACRDPPNGLTRGHRGLSPRDSTPLSTDRRVPQDASIRGHRGFSPQDPPPLSTDRRVPQDASIRGHRGFSPQDPPPLSTDRRVPQVASIKGHRGCSPRDPPPLSTDRRVPQDTSIRGHRGCSPRDPPLLSTDHRVPQDISIRGHRCCSPRDPPPLSTDRRVPQDASIRGHRGFSQRDPPPLSTDRQVPQDISMRGHKGCSSQNPPPLSTDHRVPQDALIRGYRGSSGTLRKSLSQGDLLETEEKARRMARTVERELWASVPDRDKKIGALMLLRYQEEEMSKQRRLQAQQAWDNLKTKERSIQAALDKRDWPIELRNYRRRSWSSQLDMEAEPIHMSSYKEQKALFQYGLAKAKTTCLDGTSSHPLEERMINAFKAKMVKDLQGKRNLQIKNEYEKLRHSKLKEKVDNQAKAEEHVKKASIQHKEQRWQELQEKMVKERNRGLHEKATREDELKLMANLRATRLEKEQMDRKKMLARLSDHKIRQARDTLEISTTGKAERARELNSVKENVHQALKKRVEQEKENQRKEVALFIRMKDQKSERIRKEKEATLEEGRRIARASFHFRDKIRQETKSRTFDQMALQATLNASLLKTIP